MKLLMANDASTTTMAPDLQKGVDLDALYSSLVACYVTLFVGYACVKIQLVAVNDTRVIKLLLLYMLTPAMLVKCLLQLKMNDVNWLFVVCLFTAKILIFVGVAGLTMLLSKGNAAKAGLYAIFATQSNDLALGIPIVTALYAKDHFVQYLYLVIPMSLILNAIGFALIQMNKVVSRSHSYKPVNQVDDDNDSTDSVFETAPSNEKAENLFLAVLKGLTINPMLIAVAVGLFARIFLFNDSSSAHTGRPILAVIDSWSSAFFTIALFGLGITIGSDLDEFDNQRNNNIYLQMATPIMLTLVKILLMPLLLRTIVRLLNVGDSNNDEFASFAFLYGCLPSAPVVFVYAYYVEVAVKQISQSVTLSTLLSAPWLFLTAHLIDTGRQHLAFDARNINSMTTRIAQLASIISLFTLISMLANHKRGRVARIFVIMYLIALTVRSICVAHGDMNVLEDYGNSTVATILRSRIFIASKYGVYITAAALAAAIYTVHRVSCCVILRQKWTIVSILALAPVALSILFWPLQYSLQTTCEVLMLSVSIILCTLFVAFHQALNADELDDTIGEMEVVDVEDCAPQSTNNQLPPVFAVEKRMCHSTKNCSHRRRCQQLLLEYEHGEDETIDSMNSEQVAKEDIDDMGKCVLLLCAALVHLVIRLFTTIWLGTTNVNETRSGLLALLITVDVLLAHSQALFVCLLFGLSSAWTVKSTLRKFIARYKYGSIKLAVPHWHDLDQKTRSTCESFVANHLARAKQDLLTDAKRSFSGNQLIDWIVKQSLSEDRVQALKFCRRLVLGRVVAHVKKEEHMYDSKRLQYEFMDTSTIERRLDQRQLNSQ